MASIRSSWDRPANDLELPVPCHHGAFLGHLLDDHRDALGQVEVLLGPDTLRDWGLPERGVLLELGFSSRGYHALYDAPFLGFAGAMCLLGRIANELLDEDD